MAAAVARDLDDDDAEGDAAQSSIVLADPNTPLTGDEMQTEVQEPTYTVLSDSEAAMRGAVLLSAIGAESPRILRLESRLDL